MRLLICCMQLPLQILCWCLRWRAGLYCNFILSLASVKWLQSVERRILRMFWINVLYCHVHNFCCHVLHKEHTLYVFQDAKWFGHKAANIAVHCALSWQCPGVIECFPTMKFSYYKETIPNANEKDTVKRFERRRFKLLHKNLVHYSKQNGILYLASFFELSCTVECRLLYLLISKHRLPLLFFFYDLANIVRPNWGCSTSSKLIIQL